MLRVEPCPDSFRVLRVVPDPGLVFQFHRWHRRRSQQCLLQLSATREPAQQHDDFVGSLSFAEGEGERGHSNGRRATGRGFITGDAVGCVVAYGIWSGMMFGCMTDVPLGGFFLHVSVWRMILFIGDGQIY